MSGWRDRLRGTPAGKDPRSNTVSVTLVDAATDQVMGVVDLDPEQLPDSFDLSELSTTIHLGSADWRVENAEPTDRAGYLASRRLHLVLRKIEMVRSDEVRFSLPTLVDALPPTRAGDATGAYVLHEDDWRQREFVATTFRLEIEAEFDMIRAARATSSGFGYELLHVRKRIPAPLAGSAFPLFAVRSALGDPDRRDVSVGGALVVGGFAFPVSGGVVYGREDDDRVVTLALAENADPEPLNRLATENALVLVDWVHAEA